MSNNHDQNSRFPPLKPFGHPAAPTAQNGQSVKRVMLTVLAEGNVPGGVVPYREVAELIADHEREREELRKLLADAPRMLCYPPDAVKWMDRYVKLVGDST